MSPNPTPADASNSVNACPRVRFKAGATPDGAGWCPGPVALDGFFDLGNVVGAVSGDGGKDNLASVHQLPSGNAVCDLQIFVWHLQCPLCTLNRLVNKQSQPLGLSSLLI